MNRHKEIKMAFTIDTKKKPCCAICKHWQGDAVIEYIAKFSRAKVNDTSAKCSMKPGANWKSLNACPSFEKDFRYL